MSTDASPPDARALTVVNLLSVSLSAFFYGIFFVLLSAATYLMMRRQKRLQSVRPGISFRTIILRNPFQISGLLFFATITANWVTIVYRSFVGFIYFANGTMAPEYYIGTPESEIVKIGFMLGTMSNADAMLVFRLYMIWGGLKSIIIFPLITFTTSVGLCIAILVRLKGSETLIAAARVLLEACWGCSIVTNVYCCVLIAWRLYRNSTITSQVLMHGEIRGAYRAVIVFIESAFLFVGWEIIFIICYKFSTHGYPTFLIEDTWPIVSGIAFMMINLRVGMGYTTRTSVSAAGITSPAFAVVSPVSHELSDFTDSSASTGVIEGELKLEART